MAILTNQYPTLKGNNNKIYMVCKEAEFIKIYIYIKIIYKRFFILLMAVIIELFFLQSKITLQSITKLKGMNSFLTH